MEDASLFPRRGQRVPIWTAALFFRRRRSILSTNIPGLMEEWRLFFRQQYQELEKQIMDNSYLSFDHGFVFEGILKYIKAIIDSLSVRQDPSPNLERSPNISDTPRKRQKVKHNQDSA